MKLLPSVNENFIGFQKLYSYQLLSQIECSVLNSVLIEKEDVLTDQCIKDIQKHLDADHCTMRYQYMIPNSRPVRGGNLVGISIDKINNCKVDGALCWLLEPTNRLTNKYGLNIYFDRKLGRLVFECVGRVFDTSNINRGDMTPHQIITFRLPATSHRNNADSDFIEFDLGWNSEWWKYAKFNFMSEEEYEATKLVRIRMMLALGHSFDGSNMFDASYRPLSIDLIDRLLSYTKRLYECEQLLHENEVVANCSIMEDNRFVFWDIATPSGKLAILHSA